MHEGEPHRSVLGGGGAQASSSCAQNRDVRVRRRNVGYLTGCGVLGGALGTKGLGVLARALFPGINSSVVPENTSLSRSSFDWEIVPM